MLRSHLAVLAGFLLSLGAGARYAQAQTYAFLNVVDEHTPRPDGNGNFSPVSPSLEGNIVSFNQGAPCAGCAPPDSIWAVNLATGALVKLVDTTMLVPGSTVKFDYFDPDSTLKKGIVVFRGLFGGNKDGLFAVPAAGGAVAKLVDTNTQIPGTTVNFNQFFRGSFHSDGTTVVFSGSGPGASGVYSVHLDGTGLARVADGNTPVNSDKCDAFPVSNFSSPAIGSGTISFFGNTVFDASTGYNALYQGTLAKTVNPNCTPYPSIVNSLQNLPGNPDARFHTRYHYGLLDGQTLVYLADDANAKFNGIFSAPAAASPSGGVSTKVVDSNTSLPQYGVAGENTFEFVADQGNVIFHAYDTTGKLDALFLARSGSISKIVGVGDAINGIKALDVQAPQPGASNGADIAFVWTRSDFYHALTVARMVSPSISIGGISNAASYGSPNSVSAGEIVTVFGAGMGPVNYAGAALDSSGKIATQVAGVRIFFNGVAAPIVSVSATQSSVIVPFEGDGQTTANVVVEYQGGVSAPFPVQVTAAAPGFFSADFSGGGQGAITNQDGTANSAANPAAAGSLIVVYGTGVGQTDPPGVDGQVSSATPSKPHQPVSVTIGGVPVTNIPYQGFAPLAVEGLYQMVLAVPNAVAPGNQPLVLTIGTASSQSGFTVAVQ